MGYHLHACFEQGVEHDLGTVSRHLALLQRTVDEELMLNANLAKLALKSTAPDFDTAAAEFMRSVRFLCGALHRFIA